MIDFSKLENNLDDLKSRLNLSEDLISILLNKVYNPSNLPNSSKDPQNLFLGVAKDSKIIWYESEFIPVVGTSLICEIDK